VRFILEEYCKRINGNIKFTDNEVSCKYFILQNGKPVCKKVLKFPLPTTISISKMIFQQLFEPMIMFSGIIFGKIMYPSWWCVLLRK
jgi:hypothetical protein